MLTIVAALCCCRHMLAFGKGNYKSSNKHRIQKTPKLFPLFMDLIMQKNKNIKGQPKTAILPERTTSSLATTLPCNPE